MLPARIIALAWPFFALASALAADTSPNASVRPLTNCFSILRLPAEEAGQRYPVKLTARVTLYVPQSQLCFVQDSSGGVYVLPERWPSTLSRGDVVEIEGETAAGRFSSIVNLGAFKSLGREEPMSARSISIEQLNSGRLDCQVVEVEGVVHGVEAGGQLHKLELRMGGSSASLLVFGETPISTNLADAHVRIRGVAGTLYEAERLSGFGLFVNDPGDIKVLQPSPAPFSAPLRSMEKLHVFAPEAGADHRLRVRGVVTVAWPSEVFFIQEGNRALRVLHEGAEPPAPGDLVEVSGFVPPLKSAPEIQRALFRKIGSREAMPAPISLDQPASNRWPVFSSMEGTLLRAESAGQLAMLTVDTGARLLTGYLPAQNNLPPQGSRVRLSGVWNIPPSALGETAPPGLWLNASNSLEMLAPPPPPMGAPSSATERNVQTFALIGTAAWALFFTGAAWRSSRIAKEKARELQGAHDRALQFERNLDMLNEARERLGRDLHDSAIQAIYAVGLNIDDCTQQLRTNPERVESRLKSAMGDINAVIRELRNVILGLETSAIQPKEFRTALKSLSLALGHEKSNRMRLDIDQSAVELLSPMQATELIHIAREGLSNSLRHGNATTTTFSLHSAEGRIRFTVEDDGCGFDARAPARSGFGLRNMAKRAEHLGAILTISSELGKGTRIVLDIPRQKQHFSDSEPNPRSHR